MPKSRATFYRGYRAYVASHSVTNRLEHKPGQVMDAAPMRPTPGQAYPIFALAPVQGRDVNFSTRHQHNPLPASVHADRPGQGVRTAIGWSRAR